MMLKNGSKTDNLRLLFFGCMLADKLYQTLPRPAVTAFNVEAPHATNRQESSAVMAERYASFSDMAHSPLLSLCCRVLLPLGKQSRSQRHLVRRFRIFTPLSQKYFDYDNNGEEFIPIAGKGIWDASHMASRRSERRQL